MLKQASKQNVVDSAEFRRRAIVSVAFPYAVLGPKAVGGAEVICSQVEAAVASLGFASVVVGHADSVTQGQLYETRVPEGTITDEVRTEVEAAQQAALERALSENAVALVHMHGLDFHRYRIPANVPVLVTLHLPPAWYPESIWTLPANFHFVCVSESQRRACPREAQERVSVVENGVVIPDAAHLRAQGRYALMLARICPEKNVHAGLEAARMAAIPALLGGEVFPYETHQRYFADEVEPLLTTQGTTHQARGATAEDRVSARFLGPVSGEEKMRALARAACVLLPSLAPETSSLVAMEALACGVPVVGMAVGAVPEIVEDGRTGFLIEPGPDAVEQMAAAIRKIGHLDRGECRAVAEERFPVSRMVEGYGRLYRDLALCEPTVHRADSGTGERSIRPCVDRDQIHVDELRGGEALVALAPEWLELWSRDPGATPFQHPAWLLPWWRQFGPDGELHALVLREADGLALLGFLPLYTYVRPETDERQLLLVGAGTTDYLDGVFVEGGTAVAERALTHAGEGMSCWDVASLNQLRARSLLAGAAEQLGFALETAEPCSTIDLGDELPAKIRANTRRYRRKAEAAGGVCCDVAKDVDEARACFEALVRLHSQRWERRGEDGVLRDPRVLAHHRESVPLLLEAGLLCLFHLRLGGETAGVLYGLADPPHVAERRMYLYLIGFDRRFAALSPGTLLLDEAWRYAREHGFAKLDLLRGGEEYKQLWGARSENTVALQLARRELV